MLRTAIIGGYGIGDTDSESNSSAHSAYDSPSSFVELSTSELPISTSPISVMDPNDHLWNMEEELTRNRLKTDAIEAALQNILAKLDAPQVNENAMHEEPSPRRAELAEEAENYVGEAEPEVLRKLSRVEPATPPDLMEIARRAVHFSTRVAYTSRSVDLYFRTTRLASTGHYPISSPTAPPASQTK
jgi:hypothetical protein